jgi:hypothetical protein
VPWAPPGHERASSGTSDGRAVSTTVVAAAGGAGAAASGSPTAAAEPSSLPEAALRERVDPKSDATAATAPTASVAAGDGSAGPTISVVLEQPYKLGARPDPKDPVAWKEYMRELRAWNDGGLGALRAAQPGPEGHPDPRVIIDIEQARGGLDAKAVQRVARQYHWINVVRCYRLGFSAEPTLHGWTRGRFTISRAGKVTGHKLAQTELGNRAVAQCLLARLEELGFPRAKSGTSAPATSPCRRQKSKSCRASGSSPRRRSCSRSNPPWPRSRPAIARGSATPLSFGGASRSAFMSRLPASSMRPSTSSAASQTLA